MVTGKHVTRSVNDNLYERWQNMVIEFSVPLFVSPWESTEESFRIVRKGQAIHAAPNQSIGSVMTTSSGFIREMNKISNKFAAGLSEEILKNLQKNLRE